MEWLRISTSTELVRVATDEIVYVRATSVKPQTSQFSTNAHTDIPGRRDTSNNVSKKSRTEIRMELIRKMLEQKRTGVDLGLSDFDNADK